MKFLIEKKKKIGPKKIREECHISEIEGELAMRTSQIKKIKR